MKNPLVSCTVLSYNSAKTIVETLDSIKGQTYDNIELIVSDDCSTDDTVAVAKVWIEQNRRRFKRVKLITVEKNTGVSANSNRALEACHGEWEKGIAADDILLPNCIEDFVNFIDIHPEARWVSSYARVYKNNFMPENCIFKRSISRRSFFDLTAEEQLKKIVLFNMIQPAPTFHEVSLKREVGGYDLSYSFEDYPFYITLLEHGHKCYFMEKETVGYRVHDSISNSSGKLFNYKFMLESKKFHIERCFKYLSLWQKFGLYSIWGLQYSFELLNLNKDKRFLKFVYKKSYSVLRNLIDN